MTALGGVGDAGNQRLSPDNRTYNILLRTQRCQGEQA